MQIKYGIAGAINQPIVIKVADDDVYEINVNLDTKNYIISGGKNNIVVSKKSLDEMVQYIKNNGLLN